MIVKIPERFEFAPAGTGVGWGPAPTFRDQRSQPLRRQPKIRFRPEIVNRDIRLDRLDEFGACAWQTPQLIDRQKSLRRAILGCVMACLWPFRGVRLGPRRRRREGAGSEAGFGDWLRLIFPASLWTCKERPLPSTHNAEGSPIGDNGRVGTGIAEIEDCNSDAPFGQKFILSFELKGPAQDEVRARLSDKAAGDRGHE